LARRILLADDSVTAQNMGRRILTDAGYEVVTVNNGSAALKKIAENKPDIIVLDVYMPGYGGLEVCQRVKEGGDTARIPVLLTVGKLEPFRPEEARRVGADAFIVKPFEATELLTALTKLEDKIVAAPQPQKSGRFAKALAAVEGSDFGDKETGWKNRLTIPGPNAKSRQAEAEAPPEVVAGPSRDFARSETGKPAEPKPEFERPIPAGLPADITPEEIAAITAAAASFDGKAGHPTVVAEGYASEVAPAMQAASAETTAVAPSEPEPPAATLASATELEAAPPAEAAAEPAPGVSEAVAETVASPEAAKVADVPAATEWPAAVAETDTAPQAASAAPVTESETPFNRDAEVMAAIASLAPSNGQGSTNEAGLEGAAASSVAAAEVAFAGPRWIAESVAVTLEESASTLEQEMEQASAARTAPESAASDLATATAVEVAPPAPPLETVTDAVSVEQVVASAEPVTAPIAAEASPVESSIVQETAQESVPESAPSAATQEPKPTVPKGESAFAAAAAACSGSEHVAAMEAVSSATVAPEIPERAPVASVEAPPQREAELAAAWQNWKQIRESLVSSPPAPVAGTPADEASASPAAPQAEPSAPAPVAEQVAEADPEAPEAEAASVEAPGESTAIASIVDTMLAELRPKLVEEIAKKMSSEKKDKEKEKDKKKRK